MLAHGRPVCGHGCALYRRSATWQARQQPAVCSRPALSRAGATTAVRRPAAGGARRGSGRGGAAAAGHGAHVQRGRGARVHAARAQRRGDAERHVAGRGRRRRRAPVRRPPCLMLFPIALSSWLRLSGLQMRCLFVARGTACCTRSFCRRRYTEHDAWRCGPSLKTSQQPSVQTVVFMCVLHTSHVLRICAIRLCQHTERCAKHALPSDELAAGRCAHLLRALTGLTRARGQAAPARRARPAGRARRARAARPRAAVAHAQRRPAEHPGVPRPARRAGAGGGRGRGRARRRGHGHAGAAAAAVRPAAGRLAARCTRRQGAALPWRRACPAWAARLLCCI